MLLHEFLHLTYNKQQFLQYLCDKRVIRREIECPKCHRIINITYESDISILHCNRKYYKQVRGRKKQRLTCNFKISVYHGTWFAKGHLSLERYVDLSLIFYIYNLHDKIF